MTVFDKLLGLAGLQWRTTEPPASSSVPAPIARLEWRQFNEIGWRADSAFGTFEVRKNEYWDACQWVALYNGTPLDAGWVGYPTKERAMQRAEDAVSFHRLHAQRGAKAAVDWEKEARAR